jgi:hypothetical protein
MANPAMQLYRCYLTQQTFDGMAVPSETGVLRHVDVRAANGSAAMLKAAAEQSCAIDRCERIEQPAPRTHRKATQSARFALMVAQSDGSTRPLARGVGGGRLVVQRVQAKAAP